MLLAVDPVQALAEGKYQVMSVGENRRRRGAAAILVLLSLSTFLVTSWKPAFYAGYLMMIGAGLLLAPALTLILACLSVLCCAGFAG